MNEDELQEVFGDITFVIGQTLEQICVGRYQLQLRFHDKLFIGIESELITRDRIRSREQVWKPGTEFDSMAMFEFLGKDVTDFEVIEGGKLMLIFGNYGEFTCGLAETGDSYEIWYADDDPIIVRISPPLG